MHEEYATNISLALQGYWVRPSIALHCMPHQALLCSSPFVNCHDAQDQALSLSLQYQALALNQH